MLIYLYLCMCVCFSPSRPLLASRAVLSCRYSDSWGYDPCREPASYWGLDKPTVVGELPATSAHYSASDMLSCSYDGGFGGDLYWA